MGSISVGERNKMLDAWAGRAAYSASAAVYVQLHTGDPGAAGTANVAASNTRVAATFGAAPSAGAISNTTEIQLDVTASEVLTHVSCWSAAAAGTFLGSDDIASATAVSGDKIVLPVGQIVLTLT